MVVEVGVDVEVKVKEAVGVGVKEYRSGATSLATIPKQ
jgi:hypothetical protein